MTSSDPDLSPGVIQNSLGPFSAGSDNDVITAAPTTTPGNCVDVFVRATFVNDAGNRFQTVVGQTAVNPYGTVDIAANFPPGYTFTLSCVNDDINLPQSCVDGGYSSANVFHGSSFTYKITAPELGTPQFVIGDVEPHSPPLAGAGFSASATTTQGDLVNFWGAQWFFYNFMSGPVSPGASPGSFKGYASKVNGSCGSTWESRVGNSPPPPPTIGQPVLVIVTSFLKKQGPVISGDIVQILEVLHNGGYDNNPGHRGWGYVTRIICTATTEQSRKP